MVEVPRKPYRRWRDLNSQGPELTLHLLLDFFAKHGIADEMPIEPMRRVLGD
jgi:hypothetical protein